MRGRGGREMKKERGQRNKPKKEIWENEQKVRKEKRKWKINWMKTNIEKKIKWTK